MRLIKKILVAILTLESRLVIAKYKPFVVAVTGSVGKTSTKDAIYCVLQRQNGFVRKSEKSMNSEIGLPLTIIGAPNAWRSVAGWVGNIIQGMKLVFGRSEYPDLLVLEIGADHPGDIKNVAKWLKPDIVVMTKISHTPVHVEFFRSPEEVFEEKAALARAVKDGGTLVLFGDDDKVASLGNKIGAERAGKAPAVMTYGTAESANVRGFDYSASGMEEGLSFKVGFGDRIETVKVADIVGRQHMYPLLAAAAVGKVRGLSPDDIMRGLYDYEPPRGRMNVLGGVNGSFIIDDSYNSSPDAALSALETLKEAKCAGRRIAVLGDMMELGRYSAEEHKRIGREVTKAAGVLITVGPRSHATADAALQSGMPPDAVKSFDSSADAAPYVASIASEGDIILVKGSQSPRLERVTKALLKEPEKADRLLVRQEKEWLDR